MSKRTLRAGKAILWLAAFAAGGVPAVMLMRANRPPREAVHRSASGDPEATGAIRQMRWCGVAPWCR